MGRPRILRKMLKCLVCCDSAKGNNFGVVACLACAAFFRKTIKKNRSYKCKCGGTANIGNGVISERKKCAECRFIRCVAKGMRAELVQNTEQAAIPNAPAAAAAAIAPSPPLIALVPPTPAWTTPSPQLSPSPMVAHSPSFLFNWPGEQKAMDTPPMLYPNQYPSGGDNNYLYYYCTNDYQQLCMSGLSLN